MPVYNTVSYEFPDSRSMADAFTGRSDDPDYSRVTNPTVIQLQEQVRMLTGASRVLALNSGMAAISGLLLSVASAGKSVVASNHLFGNTWLLLTRTLPRFAVRPVMLPLSDPDEVERQFPDDACCLFLESVTNPQMEVADIRRLAEVAHRHGVPLVVDTTIVPFTLSNARELGVDFEVVSSTKYVSGGATCLGGLIMDYGNFPEVTERIFSDVLFNFGSYMTPQAAYMHLLGLETLEVRYRRQERSALEVARFLQSLPGVVKVRYPGLESDEAHEATMSQYGGTGAMLTVELASEAACRGMIDRLKVFRRATNLFDNKSLAIHPHSTIFGTISEEKRREMEVSPNVVRLSIGLEAPEDLCEDLRQALGQ